MSWIANIKEGLLLKRERLLFFSIVLFLPTQLGKHFWPSFSRVDGIRIDFLSPTIYLTDILILLLFTAYTLSVLITHKVKISNFKFQISNKIWKAKLLYWILVVLVLIASILLSLSPIAGFYKLLKIAEMGFLGFYIAQTVGKKDFPTILLLLSIGVLFESSLAISQFINQSSIGGTFWFFGERTFSGQTVGIANASIDGRLVLRPYGTFSHPNVLAGYLVITITCLMYDLRFMINDLRKILVATALVIGTAALFITLSRVAILLWILIGGFFFVKKFINHSSFIIRLVLVLLLIAGIGVIGFSPLPSRFVSLVDIDRETIMRRQELNVAAIEMVKTSPIFGVGLNNFLIELPRFQKLTAGPLWLQPVHNMYLLIAAETGLIGLGTFLCVLVATFRKLKTKKEFQISNFKFQILFLVLFLAMFDHYFLTLQQGQLLLAVTLGFAWMRKI